MVNPGWSVAHNTQREPKRKSIWVKGLQRERGWEKLLRFQEKGLRTGCRVQEGSKSLIRERLQ